MGLFSFIGNLFGGGNDAKKEADRARAEERARQNRIRGGTQRIGDIFGQFTPDYFTRQGQSYLDYATPQLEDQYRDAQKQLAFSLARSGNTESSVRGDLAAELEKTYGLGRQKLADQALDLGNRSRAAIEDARGGLVSMLNSTGDVEGATQEAIRRASILSQQPQFSPLANMFADFTGILGTQQAAQKAYEAGGVVGPIPALFQKRRGTVVTT
jgi:hypothetical protein